MNMELGTAKRVITPPRPVRLAGYATRNTPFDSVLEDIYVRVHDYRCGSARAVLVYGDLLWWNSEFVAMARPCLAAALGVKEEQILFTASHNHSGPGTGGNFTSLLETVDAEYTEFLYTQVEAAACAAAQNVEPVRGTVHRGECALNVRTRRKHRTPACGRRGRALRSRQPQQLHQPVPLPDEPFRRAGGRSRGVGRRTVRRL